VPTTKATNTSRPRRGRPGYDREGLLDVAVALFNERGYDGTTMDDLAGRLGLTKSAIYHHVAGKEALLGLALDRALDQLFAAAEAIVGETVPAASRLERLIESSVEVLVAELPFVTLLLRVRGNTAVERAALARRRRFDHLVAGLVAEAQADGDIRTDIDAGTVGRLLFGLVNSLTEWYRPGSGAGPAELAAAVRAVAFEGVGRPQAAGRARATTDAGSSPLGQVPKANPRSAGSSRVAQNASATAEGE
jgi:AcrR family transcriptional regulator